MSENIIYIGDEVQCEAFGDRGSPMILSGTVCSCYTHGAGQIEHATVWFAQSDGFVQSKMLCHLLTPDGRTVTGYGGKR